MMDPVTVRRPITLRANRDTLAVAALACGLAFVLGSHGRDQKQDVATLQPPAQEQTAPADQRAWIGQLDQVSLKTDDHAGPEPLTSASLVVPKADLALPRPDKAAVKGVAKPCDGPACARSVPMVKHAPSAATASAHHARRQPDLLAQLNPLDHVPDVVKRPFVYAGDMVSGLFHQF